MARRRLNAISIAAAICSDSDDEQDPDYLPVECEKSDISLDSGDEEVLRQRMVKCVKLKDTNKNVINTENVDTHSQLYTCVSRGRPRKREYCKIQDKIKKCKGQLHFTYKDAEVPEKKMKVGCSKCSRKCRNKFSEEERKTIFEEFWNLGNTDLQRNFIVRTTTTKPTERKTTKKVSSRRDKTYQHFFYKDELAVQVCQTFYLDTLSITQQWIRTALQKVSSQTGVLELDKRGKHSHPQVGEFLEERYKMREFLETLPTMPSHYCRSESNRIYLPPDFTIRKCFELYKEKRLMNNEEMGSYNTFYDVFKSLNLSIHNPKKDQCSTCTKFMNAPNPKTEKMYIEHEKHLRFKEEARMRKEEAKAIAGIDTKTLCIVFDFQGILMCPKGETSVFYYSRRLSCLNFTIFDVVEKKRYMLFLDGR